MISYKVKLIVDKDSELKLNNVLEAERYVFNFCSKRHFDKDAWYGSSELPRPKGLWLHGLST